MNVIHVSAKLRELNFIIKLFSFLSQSTHYSHDIKIQSLMEENKIIYSNYCG